MDLADSYGAHNYKCESILEDTLYDGLCRHLPALAVKPQYNVATRAYRRRIDFAICIGEDHVGIEVDGKHHLRHAEYDRLRDAVILAEQKVLWIYRIPGWMLSNNSAFAIECLSPLLPNLLKNTLDAFSTKMAERAWACDIEGRVTMVKKISLNKTEPLENPNSTERVCVGNIHNSKTLQKEIAEVEMLSTEQLYKRMNRYSDYS